MEIRPFAEPDTPAVVALWGGALGYDAPHNEPLAAIRRKLAHQRELFFVAMLEGRLAGTVMAGYDGHRGWIYSLAVAPDLRRRGVGRALMNHAEGALADLGCPKINLQVVGTNAEVVGFYRALGYRVEDRVSLGKILNDPGVPASGGSQSPDASPAARSAPSGG